MKPAAVSEEDVAQAHHAQQHNHDDENENENDGVDVSVERAAVAASAGHLAVVVEAGGVTYVGTVFDVNPSQVAAAANAILG